ncbi:hypothetical protein I79_021420 [Cricetulus griseus]|uniref:Uncharacterized protein n=1 Tax=Cricetulus griseus TaxID=10029 RepID=G3ICM2_CRIGR|nr:hypothetical protein I79_021420 [Cricetulus griseus]
MTSDLSPNAMGALTRKLKLNECSHPSEVACTCNPTSQKMGTRRSGTKADLSDSV